jgi:hypothetical protein
LLKSTLKNDSYAEKKLKNLIQGGSGAFGNAATRLEMLAMKGAPVPISPLTKSVSAVGNTTRSMSVPIPHTV